MEDASSWWISCWFDWFFGGATCLEECSRRYGGCKPHVDSTLKLSSKKFSSWFLMVICRSIKYLQKLQCVATWMARPSSRLAPSRWRRGWREQRRRQSWGSLFHARGAETKTVTTWISGCWIFECQRFLRKGIELLLENFQMFIFYGNFKMCFQKPLPKGEHLDGGSKAHQVADWSSSSNTGTPHIYLVYSNSKTFQH